MPRPADPNAKVDLLRAAEAVFVERGLDHAKVEEITARAGHSKGSFYLHFGSKEDAFRQIIESMLARLATCLDQSAAMHHGITVDNAADYLARWRDNDTEMFEFIWANRRVVRLMLEGGGSASFGYMIDQFADRSREHTKRILAWGVAIGLYRADLDVETASLLLAGGYDRVAREVVRQERKPDLAALLAAVQRFCLVGLAAPRLVAVIDSQVNNEGRSRPAPGRIHAKPAGRRPRTVRRSPVP